MKVSRRQLREMIKESIIDDDPYRVGKEFLKKYGRKSMSQQMIEDLPYWNKLRYLFGNDLYSGRQAASLMESFLSEYRIDTIEEVFNPEKAMDLRAANAKLHGKDIVSIRLIFENPTDDNNLGDKKALEQLVTYLHDSLMEEIKANGKLATRALFNPSGIYISRYPTVYSRVRSSGPTHIIELNYIVDPED